MLRIELERCSSIKKNSPYWEMKDTGKQLIVNGQYQNKELQVFKYL